MEKEMNMNMSKNKIAEAVVASNQIKMLLEANNEIATQLLHLSKDSGARAKAIHAELDSLRKENLAKDERLSIMGNHILAQDHTIETLVNKLNTAANTRSVVVAKNRPDAAFEKKLAEANKELEELRGYLNAVITERDKAYDDVTALHNLVTKQAQALNERPASNETEQADAWRQVYQHAQAAVPELMDVAGGLRGMDAIKFIINRTKLDESILQELNATVVDMFPEINLPATKTPKQIVGNIKAALTAGRKAMNRSKPNRSLFAKQD